MESEIFKLAKGLGSRAQEILNASPAFHSGIPNHSERRGHLMNLVLRATTTISVEQVPRSVPMKLDCPKSLFSAAEAASSSNTHQISVTAMTGSGPEPRPDEEGTGTTPVGGPVITENAPEDLEELDAVDGDERNPVSGSNQQVDDAKEILEELTEASKPASQMLLSGEAQDELSVSDPQTVSAVVNYMKAMDGEVQALARGMSFLIEKQQREHGLSK
jgi:hypothetical protein